MNYNLYQPSPLPYSDSNREPDDFTGYESQYNTLRQMTRPEPDEHAFGPDHLSLRHNPFRRSLNASYRNQPPTPNGYRSPFVLHSGPSYEQNSYRLPANNTTDADHIIRVLQQKRAAYNQNADSQTSTTGRRNHPNPVTIKSTFTVPRSLQGHKLGLSNPTEVTTTRGVIESAVQGHFSTPQEPHHVSFDLSEFAGTNLYKRNTVGLMIAKAITTEGFDKCITTLATARAKKYLNDIAGTQPHGMDSSSSDGGSDREHPTTTTDKPPKQSPLISRISPTDRENDASETTISAKEDGDQDDDKTVADNRSRGMVGDPSKTETPHQTMSTPFATSYSDEEIKSRIETKITLGVQADIPSKDIDFEHLLDAAIQEIQSEVSITYTGTGIDQKAQAQVGFPMLQAYLHSSMQHLLINIDSEWTKAAATNSSHQTKARLLEDARSLGSCAVLMHLGIRQTLKTCSVETEMIMASAVSTELDHQTSRCIQTSKIGQPIDFGPVAWALGVSAPYFAIFDALSRGLVGSQTRDEALEQAKNYQNSTPGPGESQRSYSLSVFAKHRALIESEMQLPPEEVIVTPNLHQFNPSAIIISYWRSNADLSAHPGVHTILYQAEAQLAEITSAGYSVALQDDFQKDVVLRAATALDRLNIDNDCSARTKNAWHDHDHKPKYGKKNTWNQGATTNKAFLYTGTGCPYCGIVGHDVKGCLKKAWDKHNRQMGVHCIDEYRQYQESVGRGHALVEKTHRSVSFPSHLPDGGTEDDYSSIVRTGKLGSTVEKAKNKPEVASLMNDMKAFMEQHKKEKDDSHKQSRTKKHYSKRGRDRRKARDQDDQSDTSDSDPSPSEHSDED